MNKFLKNLEKYIIFSIIFLAPLAVFSIFPNSFLTIKLSILSFGVVLALFVRMIRILSTDIFEIKTSKLDFAVFLLFVSYLLSTILRTPNKMEALFFPGTTLIILSSILLYFLVNQFGEKDKETTLYTLFGSGVIASLVSIFSFLGVFSKMSNVSEIIKQLNFNTFGSPLIALIFFVSILPLGIYFSLSKKQGVVKALSIISSVIVALGIVVSIKGILPPNSPSLVDYNTSWVISIDTLKQSPLLGVGPGNYLTAFNNFRPISYNQGDFWNVKFVSARSFYLTLLVETGFFGLFALVLIFIGSLKGTKEKLSNILTQKNGWKYLSLLFVLISLLLIPSTISMIMALFVLLALNTETKKISIKLSIPENKSVFAAKIPTILMTIPVIVGIGFFLFNGVKILDAEINYRNALVALSENDGQKTYDLMQQTVTTNRFSDRYRKSFAQINLTLAQGIASKESVSDEDRATITQLIQQAVNEAKAGIALNQTRSDNWELLARVYQTIIAFAEGADGFAISSYNQAIALDPTNPLLRINLGGLYYSLGDHDKAIKTLELAVLTKPDYPNAHYNLAFALRENGEVDKAIEELTLVLSLLDKTSADYELAKTELENLEARKVQITPEESENLNLPEETEQIITPPIELPEDSSPPATTSAEEIN